MDSSVGTADIVTMGFNPWTGIKPPTKSAVGTDDNLHRLIGEGIIGIQ
ncbi:MAG TPA: hypothetical protein VK957_16850 [Lunatimonas sp.]|nr:hypothetical protein [Lunatimonas sp.]